MFKVILIEAKQYLKSKRKSPPYMACMNRKPSILTRKCLVKDFGKSPTKGSCDTPLSFSLYVLDCVQICFRLILSFP